MGKLNVGNLEGNFPNYRVTLHEDSELGVGSQLIIQNQQYMPLPSNTQNYHDNATYGARGAVKGAIRWNTTTEDIEVYDGSVWVPKTPPAPTVGTQSNPARSGMEIFAAGLPSGNYWIQPDNQTAYEMYVDNTRNGGGWVLTVVARTATCQDHISNNAVRISGTTGPRTSNTQATKMADSWIQALRNSSTYTGSTAYWMEALGFNKNVFIATAATVNLVDSASNDNNRTIVSTTFEGPLSDRGPNTGTRGFGDHHTSGGTYFAYGRHPEEGNNCGFRSDSNGASDGYLWVK